MGIPSFLLEVLLDTDKSGKGLHHSLLMCLEVHILLDKDVPRLIGCLVQIGIQFDIRYLVPRIQVQMIPLTQQADQPSPTEELLPSSASGVRL